MFKSGENCLQYLGISKEKWGHFKTGPVILNLISKFKIKSFVEVGTQTGYLSELIAKLYPDLLIYCIDIKFVRPHLGAQYKSIKLIEGDSAEKASLFKNASIDLVYIDADHSFESVKKDLAAWFPKARKIISGHDYQHPSHPGCTLAINDFFSVRTDLKLQLEDYYNWWAQIN